MMGHQYIMQVYSIHIGDSHVMRQMLVYTMTVFLLQIMDCMVPGINGSDTT